MKLEQTVFPAAAVTVVELTSRAARRIRRFIVRLLIGDVFGHFGSQLNTITGSTNEQQWDD
jgi:transketolase N-terminal domain/subunit